MAQTLVAHPQCLTRTCSRVPTGYFEYKTNHGRLELPLASTNFHGPKHVQATLVLLYHDTHRYICTLHGISGKDLGLLMLGISLHGSCIDTVDLQWLKH